jgi:hypothetical protein
MAEDLAADWIAERDEDRRAIREARDRARADRDMTLALGGVVDQLAREARDLVVLAMESAGYHRAKGVWRRRRKKVSDENAKLAAPGATGETRAEMERKIHARISALEEDVKKGGPGAEYKVCKYFDAMQSAAPDRLRHMILEVHGGNPAKAAEDELVRRYAGEDLFKREAAHRSLAQFRTDLAGEGPTSAIERVLIGRASLCWLASCDADLRAARTADLLSWTPAEKDFYQRAADRCSRRLNEVLKALDLVRRKASPVLQVNLTTGNIQVGANERTAQVAGDADTGTSRNLKLRA